MAALIDVSHLAEIIPVIRTWWSNPFACLLKILTGTSSLICLGFTAAQRSLAKVAVSFQIIEMFNTVAPSPSSYSQSSGRRDFPWMGQRSFEGYNTIGELSARWGCVIRLADSGPK
ncbi:hypothetical protein POX_c04033 [Penicillium oxalicum]|uniref:Uncharacterized protein n=1 Tax=Penicillium oxalicum (strain 114-2 / CGMCC 5302) TaxID=933388 RepID=S7Z699_PENO1|nr:hypothetical protein POX_c04033 [Penicillium oxalicum]EPS25659.1 hypothetical protein PDE_00593 [Penicillium oxalicum 114-2]KAI2791177.1 hypothetical protein POX_c04033 [Penicillium oxalicum]